MQSTETPVRRSHPTVETIVLTLDGFEGDIIPKARPRFLKDEEPPSFSDSVSLRLHLLKSQKGKSGRKRTYMPKEYVEWKNAAMRSLQSQWRSLGYFTAIQKPVRVYVQIEGKYRQSRDTDNSCGAVLDAMVKAGVLPKDNIVAVPGSSAEVFYDKNHPPIAYIFIDILDVKQGRRTRRSPA